MNYTETQINTMFSTLSKQRNDAMDDVVRLSAALSGLTEELTSAQAKIKELESKTPPLEPAVEGVPKPAV